MSTNVDKFNEFSLELRRASVTTSKDNLNELSFKYGITENENIERLVFITKMGSYVSTLLGMFSILIGIFSTFYGSFYLTLFAMICILHLITGPLVFLGFEKGKRYLVLGSPFISLFWISFVLIYSIFYIFIGDNNKFDADIMHHFFLFIYFGVSTAVEVIYIIILVKLLNYFEEKTKQLSEQKN